MMLRLIALGCMLLVASVAGGDDFDELVKSVSRLPGGSYSGEALAREVSEEAVEKRKDLLVRAGAAQKIKLNKPSPSTQFPLALCKLSGDPSDSDSLAYIPRGMVYRGKDCTFGKSSLSRIYYMFGDALDPKTREGIRQEATTWDGFLGGGTENHVAMRRVSGLMFGEAFLGETFHYGLTGEQLAEECRDYMRRYGRAIYHNSMVEYLSPAYLAIHMSGWLNVAELAKDPESRLLGQAIYDYMNIDLALNSHHGQILPPLTRAKGQLKDEYQLSYARQQAPWVGWLYWGGGNTRQDEAALETPEFMDNIGSGHNMQHAVSGWMPHPVIRNLGAKRLQTPFMVLQSRSTWATIEPSMTNAYGKKGIVHEQEPDSRYVLRSVYVDRHYAIGAGYHRKSLDNPIMRNGLPFAVVWESKHPRNRLVVANPYWYTVAKRPDSEQLWGRDDWAGWSPFGQMAHWENAVVYLFDIPEKDPYAGNTFGKGSPHWISERTPECIQAAHVYVPESMTGKVQTPAGWFLRDGGVYVAIRPLQTGSYWEKGGNLGYERLVVPGALTGVVIETGDEAEYGSFEEFQQRIGRAGLDLSQLETDKRVVYRSTRGHTIDLRHNPDGWRPVASINGTRLDFDRWPICESPYVTCRDGVLSVNDGKQGIRIDWSGEFPVYSAYDVPR